jgi:hypothetical protein
MAAPGPLGASDRQVEAAAFSVGAGTPFLPPVTDDIALELIETRTFASRLIYERYRRARAESE